MTEDSRPIRVMVLISRLNIGGPAMHAALLVKRFGFPDYESVLVCGESHPDGGDMAYFARAQGIEPLFMPEMTGSSNPLHALKAIYHLRKLMQEFKPDIVHTHMAKAGFLGRVAAWLAGVPVIVHTYHYHVFGGDFDPLRTRLFIWMDRLAARVSDMLIVLTQNLRHELSAVYGVASKAQMTVLPLGLDLSSFAETPRKQGSFRERFGLPKDAPLIGIVGRLVQVKNHDLFLEAAALVRQARPDARFVIVGDGEDRMDIMAKVRTMGLNDVVLMTGWQADLPPVYSDLDVLVNSSSNEGSPTPIMEALVAGCPVVATAVGGVPDMLDHGRLGLLAMPGNAESLAGAILQALRDPINAETAREVMMSRYDIARLLHDMDSLYRGLLTKKTRQTKPPHTS